jgi:hypothetical protein
LLTLLTSLHSLDDRVEPVHGRAFFDIPEYVALKALRNYFHHESEVRYVVCVKSVSDVNIISDLMFWCLVSTTDCEAAIHGAGSKFIEGVRQAFETSVREYGEVRDINPCIFNCVVKVYEKLQDLQEPGVQPPFFDFKNQYDWESTEGHSHYVDGRIGTHAGNAPKVLKTLMAMYHSEI